MDEQVVYEFYDQRPPADVYTASRLASWLRRHPEDAAALRLTREHLLARTPEPSWVHSFRSP